MKLVVLVLSSLLGSVVAAGCATEDIYAPNRESALAMAKADTGCTQPMTADLLNSTDAGLGANRVRDAVVVVQGCGKTARYHTTCEHTMVAQGCQAKPEGAIVTDPTATAAAPAPAPTTAPAAAPATPAPASKP
ncbi:MAG TPA: hypothetical protein VGO62_17325 [Myxococcota bacterium]